MNVSELNPKVIVTTAFSMICPVCQKHRISVNIGPSGWQWDGQTLTPSIRFEGPYHDSTTEHSLIHCKGHFTITNGQVNIEP